jgi:hypothetical protein
VILLKTNPFVEGSPDGGTIVRAAFLNAVLGELTGILSRAGVEPLTEGDAPEDHHQIIEALESRYLRVGYLSEIPPSIGAIALNVESLINGAYPFYICRDGQSWERVPLPELYLEPALPGLKPQGGTGGSEGDFDDAAHGLRGADGLHAPATEFVAGFQSPESYRLLGEVASSRPVRFVSDWLSVEAGATFAIAHNLGRIPEQVSVSFKPPDESRVSLCQSFYNPQSEFCGFTAYGMTETHLTMSVGDRAWAGQTDTGWMSYSNGYYQISITTYGNPLSQA